LAGDGVLNVLGNVNQEEQKTLVYHGSSGTVE